MSRHATKPPPELAALLQLLSTYHAVQRRVATLLDGHDVTLPQFDALTQLARADGMSQQELADKLLVTKGNVVGLVDRLSARGWVERAEAPGDRRVNVVRLTAAGHRLVAAALPAQWDLVKELFGGLSAGEREALVSTLKAVEGRCG